MAQKTLEMTMAELERLKLIGKAQERQMTQARVAMALGVSDRHVRRLVRRLREEGEAGLVSQRRGREAANKVPAEVRQEAMALTHERYSDFGPTLLAETLVERHGIRLSRETLRGWLAEDGLRPVRCRHRARVHLPRAPRARFGELVQVDGSPHDWFEGRGPRCCLIVFIDDATSQLCALRFVQAETTQAYMETLSEHLARHGRPAALYTDRHSIFTTQQGEDRGRQPTQFARALATLDIALVTASTPQAKGRVERANRILQDRLVKEMRLRGIDTMQDANAFLPQFMARFNERFGRQPRSPDNAHRKVLHSPEELGQTLSLHHVRTLSKNLTFQFERQLYHVLVKGQGYAMRGAKVTLCESFSGDLTVLYKGRKVEFRLLESGTPPPPVADEKTLDASVDAALAAQARKPKYKPAPDHPWRRTYATKASMRAG